MKIFITLMGKGGVGKSFVSLIMAQYLAKKDNALICVDTDGVNLTFSRYKSLEVIDRNVLSDDGERADLGKIDSLFSELLENEAFADKTVLIDNGASSFTPVRKYLIDSQITKMDLDITFLIPLMSGESLDSTMLGASDLLNDFDTDVKYLIFQNQRDGELKFDGSKLQKAFKSNNGYLGSVLLPQIDPKSLLGADYATAVQNSILYANIDDTDKLKLLSKSRLKQYYEKVFTQLEMLGVWYARY